MGYAWQEESEKEGGSQAEKMIGGDHDVRIVKIVYGKADGTQFVSRGRDPQIMIVFQNHMAHEVGMMVTLSDKAGWVLAKLLGCCDPPVNLAAMQAQGVEPIHFADVRFAEKNLLNRQLKINVEWPQGKKHPNVTPIKSNGQTTALPVGAPPVVTNATQVAAQVAAAGGPPAFSNAPPTPTPPAPARATAPTPSPAAVTAEMPPGLNKDQAWAIVLDQWSGMVESQGDTAQARRNEGWTKATQSRIQSTGRAEQKFTSEDWQAVVSVACVPF